MIEVCVSQLDSFLSPPRNAVLALPWNRLHVLVNHFVVSGLPVAQVRTDDRDVTGETKREQGLVVETNVDAKRPIVDGMTHVIHNLTVETEIPSRGIARTCGLRPSAFTFRHCSLPSLPPLWLLLAEGSPHAATALNDSISD